jgi:hypothetical protein
VAQPAQNGNEQNGLSTRVLLTPDDRQYLKILATQLPAALNASVNEERGSQVNNGASEATTGGGWMPAWFGSPTKSKSTNA